MNNTVWIYRVVEEEKTNMGPYQYCALTQDRELLDTLMRHEPREKERKWVKNLMDKKINKYGVASYTLHRPGITEDPLLRHNLNGFRRRINYWHTGFRDLDQFKRWFNDEQEWNMLQKRGFKLKRIKVPARNIVQGDRQLMVIY